MYTVVDGLELLVKSIGSDIKNVSQGEPSDDVLKYTFLCVGWSLIPVLPSHAVTHNCSQLHLGEGSDPSDLCRPLHSHAHRHECAHALK